MIASLGAGAIVMLTKSKSHWLYIDFHEQNADKSVVLHMDKKEYKNIFDAVKTHTGKEVEFLGDAKDQSKKEQKKKNTKRRVADVESGGLVRTDSASAAIAQFMESPMMRTKRADQVVTRRRGGMIKQKGYETVCCIAGCCSQFVSLLVAEVVRVTCSPFL
jgi:hypothetical protein